jgi:hypothetical protein
MTESKARLFSTESGLRIQHPSSARPQPTPSAERPSCELPTANEPSTVPSSSRLKVGDANQQIGNPDLNEDSPSTMAVESGSHFAILSKPSPPNSESTGSTRDISPLEAFFNSSSLRIHPTCSDKLPEFEYTQAFLAFVIVQFNELEHRGLVVKP